MDVDIEAWNLELELIVLNVRRLGALGIGIGNSTEYRAGIRLTDCTPPQYRAIGLRIGRNRSRSLPTSIPLSLSSLPSGVQLQWPVFISPVSGGHGSLRISLSRRHSASLHRAAPPHPSVRCGVVGPAPLLSVPNSGGAPLRPLSAPAALPSVPGKLRRRSHPSPTPALLPSAPSVFLPSSPPTRWSGRRRSSPPSPTPAALWMQIRRTAVVRRLTPRARGCEMRRPAVMARMRRPI